MPRSTAALAAFFVAAAFAGPGSAQGTDTYLRLELGGAFDATGGAFWEPPGFPADPQVHFDLSADTGYFASVAVGQEFANGLRGDVSLSLFGETDFSGPWSHTVPVVAGPHADITGGSVRSTALMFNGYWTPFGGNGNSGGFQPFVTAGLGFSQNAMSDWTRTNAAAPSVNRTFEGATNTDFAWSIGAGVTANLGNTSPVLFEATYRYFDLGTATGSGVPLPGNGTSSPVTPLTYQQRDHVLSVGIRIPIGGS